MGGMMGGPGVMTSGYSQSVQPAMVNSSGVPNPGYVANTTTVRTDFSPMGAPMGGFVGASPITSVVGPTGAMGSAIMAPMGGMPPGPFGFSSSGSSPQFGTVINARPPPYGGIPPPSMSALGAPPPIPPIPTVSTINPAMITSGIATRPASRIAPSPVSVSSGIITPPTAVVTSELRKSFEGPAAVINSGIGAAIVNSGLA